MTTRGPPAKQKGAIIKGYTRKHRIGVVQLRKRTLEEKKGAGVGYSNKIYPPSQSSKSKYTIIIILIILSYQKSSEQRVEASWSPNNVRDPSQCKSARKRVLKVE